VCDVAAQLRHEKGEFQMIRWAGRLIVAIGVGHMLIGLALTAPHHVDAWFSGAVWDDNLAHMSAANGAYWLTFGSFGVPQTVIGLMVLWLDRRGIVPPSFIACTGGQCRDLRHDLRPVLAMAPSTCSRPPCCWPVPAPPAAAPPLRYKRHRKATQLGDGCDGQAGWKPVHASRHARNRACRASPRR
jgi:hypothetical protein